MKVNKEIKRFLRGRVYVQDGIIAVEQELKFALMNWQGFINGSVNTVLFGVSRREISFKVPDTEEGFMQIAQCFVRIGRIAALLDTPEVLGCFKKNGIGNVVFYTLEKELYGEGTMTVTMFTGRSPVSAVRLLRAEKTLMRQITEDMDITVMSKEERKELKAQMQPQEATEQQEAKEKKKETDASLSGNHRIR